MGAAPLVPFQAVNGRWGYLDAATRKPVITPQFDDARPFQDGAGLVAYPNPRARGFEDSELYGYVRADGKPVFAQRFSDVGPVVALDAREPLPDLREVTLPDQRAGIVSLASGKWLVDPVAGRPDHTPEFRFYSRQRYLVNGEYLIMDGMRVDAPTGTRITGVDFDGGVLDIEKDSRGDQQLQGIADLHGNVLVPPVYISLEFFPTIHRAIGTRFRSAAAGVAALAAIVSGGRFPRAAVVTELLDGHGAVIRSFGQGVEVDRTRNGTGYYRPADDASDFDTRYFDMQTGKDIPARVAQGGGGFHIFHLRHAGDVLFGLQTAAGQVLVPARYRSLAFVDKTLLIATDAATRLQGVVDVHGNTVVPFDYRTLDSDGAGRLTASRDGRLYGVIDLAGHVVIAPLSDHEILFDHGRADVYLAGLQGVIDPSGKVLVPTRYQTLFDTHVVDKTPDHYYAAQDQRGSWGLLDPAGRVVVPFNYGFVSVDKDAFAQGWVELEDASRDHAGLVNVHTGVQVPPQFNSLKVHADCIVATRRDDAANTYSYQLLGFDGKPVSAVFSGLDKSAGGYFVVRDGKYTGVIDGHGKVVVPLRYAYVWDRGGGYFEAESEGRHVYVDVAGNVYSPR